MRMTMSKFKERLDALVKRSKANPEEDPIISVPDCIGRPTRIHLSNLEKFQKQQAELLKQIEAGEVWDPRKGPSPEQQELNRIAMAEFRAAQAKKAAEQNKK